MSIIERPVIDSAPVMAKRKPAMKRSEFLRIRKSLGVSQARMASLLGTSTNSVQRQEQGSRPIVSSTAKLVRLVAAVHSRYELSVDDIAALMQPARTGKG